MASNEDEMQEIAAEIERHLMAEPMAADSVEGIRRWWIATTIGERTYDVVRCALEELERRGVVERRPVQGVAVIWGARRPTSH
jgi:hypothetical protein